MDKGKLKPNREKSILQFFGTVSTSQAQPNEIFIKDPKSCQYWDFKGSHIGAMKTHEH